MVSGQSTNFYHFQQDFKLMNKIKLFLIGLYFVAGQGNAFAQSVQFPADAVINILDYEPNANDGQTDATIAIQQAIEDHSADLVRRFTLYFPAGTYRLSAPVFVDAYNANGQGGNGKGIVLQGEGKDFTILKLTDNNPLFQDTNAPVPLLSTAGGGSQEGWTNISFMNSLFDLTIDVGTGNPGAIGLRYIANNQGSVKDVCIRSTGPGKAGWAGIDMERASIPGPALLKNVDIIGFDYGIRLAGANYGTTIEHLHVQDCHLGGIRNHQHILNIRKLSTENINGPAVLNTHPDGLLTIVDSELDGPAGQTALINNGYLFARNIQVEGYSNGLNDHGELFPGDIAEERYGELVRLWQESPDTAIHLPVVETPEIPYDPVENWVNITDFGYEPGTAEEPNYTDAGPAIQAAIAFMNEPGNESKTTLYFEPGEYRLASPFQLYGNVKRVVGNFATIWPKTAIEKTTVPIITIEDTDYETLIIERINLAPACCDDRRRQNAVFRNNSSRDVVLQHIYIGHGKAYEKGTATGRLFLEDVCALSQYYYVHTHREEVLPEAIPQFDFKDQQVWARQLDPEQRETKIEVDGGQLWVLGLKTEEPGTVVFAKDEARVEVLGGTILPSFEVQDSTPVLKIENAEASFVLAEHAGQNNFNGGGYYKRIIEESRGQEHRIRSRGETPQRLQGQNTPVFVLPLYVAHGGPQVEPSYAIALEGNLDFGEVVVGQEAQRSFTVHNPGNSTLEIEEILYPEGLSGDQEPFQLPAGAETVISVTFSPTEWITYEGQIEVISNAESGDSTISINGLALPTRVIDLNGVLVFPETQTGETAEKTLTVGNTGLAELSVSAIVLPEGFQAEPQSFGVLPGESQEVAITFSPLLPSLYSGLLEVVSDATGGSNILNVAGRGVGEPVSVSQMLLSEHTSIYPNPAKDSFSLVLDNALTGAFRLRITDSKGSVKLSTERIKTTQRAEWLFAAEGWPTGVYYLTIDHEKNQHTIKFLLSN